MVANEITPTVILTLSRPKAGTRLHNHNEGAGPLVPVPPSDAEAGRYTPVQVRAANLLARSCGAQ